LNKLSSILLMEGGRTLIQYTMRYCRAMLGSSQSMGPEARKEV
jgi:hypothetical protein